MRVQSQKSASSNAWRRRVRREREGLPSGAKAHVLFPAFAARLKPCPFKTVRFYGFSAQLGVVSLQDKLFPQGPPRAEDVLSK